VTLLSLSVAFIAAPIIWWLAQMGWITFYGEFHISTGALDPAVATPILFVAGIFLFFASLHLIRAIGQLHGRFAKHVLVEASAE